ncbi:N-terminal delta endotoxin domain-containing protein [Heterostelium album PN500]|uniref:N-terminal delta endotoxin domain-containing protein n=1 Tax=Heterostelium pallidum (strain ATCC 26659 / Pp 5 / PN500) TaxID=670386 RepID=D3BME7_HETP5|nr:N-terminal delta endotoxin domain-containing protein [Heterostelium album PN500]EFA77159.1 N-terminal delta endotoxin domain-containing protein [Heterostelium album PN500]|eukprot:XP_020429288.1 N-terminal delta endotoxin domain-containing protein [Heterostelium album PN500]
MSAEHHHHHHEHHQNVEKQVSPIPLTVLSVHQIKEATDKFIKEGRPILIGDISEADRKAIQQRLDHIHAVRDDNGGSIITANDWGQIIGAVIGYTPYVGPLIKAGFNIIWGKLFSKDSQYITKDQFNKEMTELYTKVENMVNEKLDQNEINRCNAMFADCQNRGNNFNDLLTLLTQRQAAKAGFIVDTKHEHWVKPAAHLANLADDNLKEMIRSEFLSYRDFLEGAIINFSQPMYAHILGNLLSMTMFIYANMMRDAALQGIGWGFPYDYVNGSGKVKGLKAILHDKVQQYHMDLTRCNLRYMQEIIKPAITIHPAINLPDNGWTLSGSINELDFFEYPQPVKRVTINNGVFDCSDPNTAFKIFKCDPSGIAGYILDSHYDTLINLFKAWKHKFSVVRNSPTGTFGNFVMSFAMYNGDGINLYVNGTKYDVIATNEHRKGTRSCYYYNESIVQYGQTSGDKWIFSVPIQLSGTRFDFEIERGYGGLNSLEFTFNY